MFHREEAATASIHTQLVGIELMISVDPEHEPRMDHIASASATHPMTQVGFIVIHWYHCEERFEYYCNVSMCMYLCQYVYVCL